MTRGFLIVWLFVAASVIHAATDETGAENKKLVFAHYMVCFPNSVDFYKREIELAQRSGIDGFALNCGTWLFDPRFARQDPEGYVESATRIYQAAKELNTGFRLFMSPDLVTLKNVPENMVDMVQRFAAHPNQLTHQGKPVLSSYSGTAEVFAPIINQIEAKGTDVFFVPGILKFPFSSNWSPRLIRSFFDGHSHMDGVFFFGPDMTVAEYLRTNASLGRITGELGKLYMAGISPAYNSPNLRDYHGIKGYETKWRGIIQDGATWVEIVTWNDYNEDSHLMPFHWDAKALGGRQYFSHDEAFLDVTHYYATWFKSGKAPAVLQDKIYYVYRNRSKHLTTAWNAKKQAWVDLTREGNPVDQIHDDVEDNIYLTVFLTSAATLSVSLGSEKWSENLPAGISHVAYPLSPGVPQFTLLREGKPVLSCQGGKSIIGKPTQENSQQGAHLANRSWTGGAAAGEPIPLSVPNQCLIKPAAAGDAGSGSLSEAVFPVKDLKTGRYNIRITYRNSGHEDARMTLFADGSGSGNSTTQDNFFPVSFPPTTEAPGTVSFFWSLFDSTTRLRLASVPANQNADNRGESFEGDRGSVAIESIQIVPVLTAVAREPAAESVPEMVRVPGGSFEMGSRHGNPDERPVHSVAVAPFFIGKYEVTNAQYEKCDPAHRRFRDEYSWRDSDPVIYVSWNNAIRYCNWLSLQEGLTPAYDEKDGKRDPAADGYRLPTEAEWEYVASGRGEGRIFPWGNDAPTPVHGNFSGKASLDFEPALRGVGHTGSVPVGSYPLGVSRDGVMDLAGNVTEWCSDVYRKYPEGATANESDKSDIYRSIRGGSWGYYNLSQRVSDREFNRPEYGGYVYIGFRIARTDRARAPTE